MFPSCDEYRHEDHLYGPDEMPQLHQAKKPQVNPALLRKSDSEHADSTRLPQENAGSAQMVQACACDHPNPLVAKNEATGTEQDSGVKKCEDPKDLTPNEPSTQAARTRFGRSQDIGKAY